MKNFLTKIKYPTYFFLVFFLGFSLGNFRFLNAAQENTTSLENTLPEWHIIRFLQSEEFESAKRAHPQKVILINPFSVPKDEEEKFLQKFHEVSELFKNTPGFINAKLHRSVNPEAPFLFINVAVWENLDAFKAAVMSPDFKKIHKDFPYQGKASLYVVEKEYTGTNQGNL